MRWRDQRLVLRLRRHVPRLRRHSPEREGEWPLSVNGPAQGTGAEAQAERGWSSGPGALGGGGTGRKGDNAGDGRVRRVSVRQGPMIVQLRCFSCRKAKGASHDCLGERLDPCDPSWVQRMPRRPHYRARPGVQSCERCGNAFGGSICFLNFRRPEVRQVLQDSDRNPILTGLSRVTWSLPANL